MKTTTASKIAIAVLLTALTGSAIDARNHSSHGKSSVKEVEQADFQTTVLEAKGPVLVDFYATWCGPCKMMTPVVDHLAKTYKNKVAVRRMDVDKNQAIALKYNISSIPSIKIFKDGKIVDETLGVVPESELKQKIDKVL